MLPTEKPGARSLADVLPNSVSALAGESNALDLPAVHSVVVIVVDGLGRSQLSARAGHARFLAARPRDPITSVFPTTTAAALATLTTGVSPGQHGLVGYRTLDAANDRLVNQLTGWDDKMVPDVWQPEPTVFERAAAGSIRSFAVGPAKFRSSGFTKAVLRGADYRSANSLSDRFAAASKILSTGEPSLTYLYIPELDKASHQYGWESDQWLGALEAVDAEVQSFARTLPPRVGVLVTADHGSVDVPQHSQVLFDQAPELVTGVRHVGGEPRCLHLYLEPGATDADRLALATVWEQSEGERSWVASRQDAVANGLFGTVRPEVLSRIGDVIVAARKRIVYYDSRPTDQTARSMIGQHGSLTADERIVPLVRLGAFER
ncbi:alkaline phosphatase family protein [Mycetocola manganoxydans]|uniref:Alkaline phosphatase family protein n=2 Tax=Mycetocola manganoxydans TaxID=699879 RepID=A0A3L6ZXX8_9MICO|nr:alkaline phosphatase family protein [Mycetocola manganoxydans]